MPENTAATEEDVSGNIDVEIRAEGIPDNPDEGIDFDELRNPLASMRELLVDLLSKLAKAVKRLLMWPLVLDMEIPDQITTNQLQIITELQTHQYIN